MKETAIEEKIVYGSFLRDEIVSVKAVPSSGKWSNLLVAGQDNKKDPFIYNKVKRSYQVPLRNYRNGGGVEIILDDQRRVYIQKYMHTFPDGMTEKEFFEKEIGVNLNPNLPKDENFWRIDGRGRVTLDKEGVKLNLNNALDMLKYKILLSNTSLIAPSYEEKDLKATYEFMLVDEGKLTSKRVEEAGIKAKAFTQYSIITATKEKMIGFIKALGRVIPSTATEDWLKSEIFTEVEKSPANFLSIIEHPQYQAKIFVQNAIDAGAILKKGDRRYTLDNGVELGDLADVINYLGNPENQETKLRIKARIELAKK